MSFDASDLCAWAPKPAQWKAVGAQRKYWCWAPTCTEALATLDRFGFCEISPGYDLSNGVFIKSRRSGARLRSHQQGVREQVEPYIDQKRHVAERILDSLLEAAGLDKAEVLKCKDTATIIKRFNLQDRFGADELPGFENEIREHLHRERRTRKAKFGARGESLDLPIKVKCAQCGRVSIISDAS